MSEIKVIINEQGKPEVKGLPEGFEILVLASESHEDDFILVIGRVTLPRVYAIRNKKARENARLYFGKKDEVMEQVVITKAIRLVHSRTIKYDLYLNVFWDVDNSKRVKIGPEFNEVTVSYVHQIQ